MTEPRPKPGFRVPRWARTLRRRAHRGRLNKQVLSVWALLVLVGASTVLGVTQLRTDTGPNSFLPAGDPTLDHIEDAAESFGGDPIVVVAESSRRHQLLDEGQLPKLLRLEGRLAQLDDTAVVYGPGTVLNQIAASAQNMMASLSGQRDALRAQAAKRAREQGASEEGAAAAARKAVAEFDQRYGELLVKGLPAGLPTLNNPAFVKQVIFGQGGGPKDQWDFLVPSGQAISILVRPREGLDQAATESLVDRVRQQVNDSGLALEQVTVTGVPAVTAGLGEQVRREIPLLGGLALLGIGASYLLVPWLRRRWLRLMPVVVTLAATAGVLGAFGLLNRPLSLGVIAFLPILIGIGSDYPAYLIQGGGRRRVIVVALASSAAFASLALSPLPFVRDLGLALAAGQLLALGLGFAVLRLRGRRALPAPSPKQETTPLRVHSPARPRLLLRVGTLVAAGLVAAAGWAASHDLAVKAEPDKLAEGLPAVDDARHAEQVLGASGEVQLFVRGEDVLTPETLAWMRQAQDEIVVRHGDKLQPVLTPPDLFRFLGAEPTPEQVEAGVELMPEYLTHAVVRSDQRRAAMTFQLGLQDLAAQQQLLADVRANLPEPPKGVEVDVAGLPVAAARGYELVSADRYVSSGIGIAAAGLVLFIGIGRIRVALRAVLAALLAAGWGFAAMSVLEIALTPLTIVLGSLITAVACEYTTMLADPAGRGSPGRSRTVVAAVVSAALGYLALTASSLSMLREFGLVLAGGIVLSFVAARLVVKFVPDKVGGEPESSTTQAVHEEEVTL